MRPGAIAFRFPDGIQREQELNRIASEISQSRASLIIGPHGSGKTTLLHSLQPVLEREQIPFESILLHSPSAPGVRRRTSNQRRNASHVHQVQLGLRSESLLIIDGIEQLSGRSRRCIIKRATTRGHRILATSHTSFAGFTTVYESCVAPQIIESITSLLTENASPGVKKTVSYELGRRQLSTVTNVRNLLFDLYDVVADLQDNGRHQPSPPTTRI
jgi:energy-coupling factor transporter ATP-binding protein EcfA2